MSSFYFNNYVQPDETERDGMKVLYADKTDPGVVSYINDVVYDVRSGIPLHLQMLYPDIPLPLMEFRMEEAMKNNPNAPRLPLAAPPRPAGEGTPKARPFGNPYQPIMRMPCVVFIQGSGWAKQNCYQNLPSLIDIARLGFVVASVEYRPVDVAPFPAFVSDVKAAIRFLRHNYERFGIDPTRIAVWGDSSGGHTSLMVGSTGWTREFDDGIYPEESSEVCACIAYYGCSDFASFAEGGKFARPFLIDRMLGKENAGQTDGVEWISPITYIKPGQDYPRFLLMHGDMDGTVPFEQSVIMYDKLRECGQRADFYKVRGANHGQFFWTPEVLRVTGQFLRAYV